MAAAEPLLTFDLDGLTFSMTSDVADAVRAGTLDPDVGYMQGRVKVAGDMAALYGLLPLARSPGFRAALEDVKAAR
jgi:hypothetical protein